MLFAKSAFRTNDHAKPQDALDGFLQASTDSRTVKSNERFFFGMNENMVFDAEDFVRGFIAALIVAPYPPTQTKKSEITQAFHKVHKYLGDSVQQARESGDREWLKQIVRLRNRLSPGQTGAFDRLETALRVLYYTVVVKSSAESYLNTLSERERNLVAESATIFLEY